MGTIADKTVYLDGTKEAIHDAIVAKGVNIDSGATFRSYATSIAAITTGTPSLPDLVGGGTYLKTDSTPVTISAISGETTAIRLLVAATGPMRTALVLTFTGSPTIDWGDGTTTSPTSNVAAVHQYDGINPIPCGRPYGVYYITITGGTVTAVASSSDRTAWGGAVGNIIAYAIKSPSALSINRLTYSIGGFVNSSACESIYAEGSIADLDTLMLATSQVRYLGLSTLSAVTVVNFVNVSGAICPLLTVDFSACAISGNLSCRYAFANATSILFKNTNAELGDVDIRLNLLSTAAFVALFNSLPTVTSKTIQIGGSAAALALTAEQIAIATDKGWTVTRTY